ncbi:hypothetical protein EX30DRAFT_187376 [Ascodesmis nigricans]|uniref:Uncharacterized protein n=1 Tax=Ascodesmis nigricans TaxID=341454 RepID=A0A4S2N0R2_9PEZI|nr:hypothetical protein EX30DRAFT_187376 [Ascodesmis nigricans]
MPSTKRALHYTMQGVLTPAHAQPHSLTNSHAPLTDQFACRLVRLRDMRSAAASESLGVFVVLGVRKVESFLYFARGV